MLHRRPSTRQLQHIGAPLDALESRLDGENLSVLRCLRGRALRQPTPVYLVGGPVRDILIGMPVKDLDFVVEGDGPALAEWLAGELGGEVRTHPRFGTSTLVMARSRVDIVTARRETYPQPAALPQVSPGSIGDDLARRDFTINALAIPLCQTNPKIIDPHGGVQDLRSGLVRILHAKSFEDDPTRMLRAVRYEQRMGFEIEAGTTVHLREAIAEGHLASLSADRLRHELERTLEEARPELAVKRLAELGVLAAINPSLGDEDAISRLEGVAADPQVPVGPLRYLAALTFALSAGQVEAVIGRLNLTGHWAQVVRDTPRLREREKELMVEPLRHSQLVSILDGYCNEAVLAVSRLSPSSLVGQRLQHYQKELQTVMPVLGGEVLLAMGVPEGPDVGRLLAELREAKLDGSVSGEQDERRLVQKFVDQHGSSSANA